MQEQPETDPDPRTSLRLKLDEPDVSSTDPWHDDVLERGEIASRLMHLISDQSSPFVISIHGAWGTGKTFMLKRWQKVLEGEGFKAIYFNAWEDDFYNDPLVAIIGQLSQYFKDSKFGQIVNQAGQLAKPLVPMGLSTVSTLTIGVPIAPVLAAGKGSTQRDPLRDYLGQRTSKEKLKQRLGEMSAKVEDDTGHPLVFIIDELDRCRPTFAIELLERVKHVFDVPNMVFVFGVNRDELCSALQSLYGNIDADVYLRRFFDLEFTLPNADSALFARHLMGKFELGRLFSWTENAPEFRLGGESLRPVAESFPSFWGYLGLSLRDIDYCVRLMSLAGKSMPQRSLFNSYVLGLLITLKIKNLTLYRRFVRGDCHASEVLDYVDEIIPLQELNRDSMATLIWMEGSLYRTENPAYPEDADERSPLGQLKLLKDAKKPTHPEYLSKRTREDSSSKRINDLIHACESTMRWTKGADVRTVAGLIDLHQGMA